MKKSLLIVLSISIIANFTSCDGKWYASSGMETESIAAFSSTQTSFALASSVPDVSYPAFPEEYEYPVMITANGQILELTRADSSSTNGDPYFPIPPNAPYAFIGDPIQIQFRDEVPESVMLLDDVINKEGRIKFNGDVTETIPLNIQDGKATFLLPWNVISVASSNSKDYEPGATIRGFRLICRYGYEEHCYITVLRSDAIPNHS